jgi:hypothetical protein
VGRYAAMNTGSSEGLWVIQERIRARDHGLPMMAFYGTLPTLIRKFIGGYQYRVFLGSPIEGTGFIIKNLIGFI